MIRKATGAALLALLFAACGDSTAPPTPARVVVTPHSVTLDAIGATQQFTVRVEDKKGKEITGVPVTWSSTSPDVASINTSGMATALKAGTTGIRADAEGVSGSATLNVAPVPKELSKAGGDAQTGALRQVLPERPTVVVRDGNGNPIAGVSVTFSVLAGQGSVSDGLVQTDTEGKASTEWRLGCSNDNPQVLEARVLGLSVQFTATADLSVLAICLESVPDGRVTHPYSAQLEAAGGDPQTQVWDLAPGSPPLPDGLALHPSGLIDGTPTVAGAFVFEARVQDGLGQSASWSFPLRICPAPLGLLPGQSTALDAAGADGCGFFLPAGQNGDRYRIGVLYTAADPNDSLNVPTVSVQMAVESPPAPSPFASTVFPAEISWARRLDAARGARSKGLAAAAEAWRLPLSLEQAGALAEALETARATEALHHRIRSAELELLRSLGPGARPLPDRRAVAKVSAPAAASPEKISLTNPENFNSCTVGETIRAVKIAENDLMVIYQDSTQNASEPMSETHAQWMLDYYLAYGQQVIDSYFGGITDLNGDGKVVVLVTPVVESGTAAFVWSGDFFPKTSQGNWAGCPASNQMELVRFSASTISGMGTGNYQALGTLVHEVKHISSLYKSIIRNDYQPLFVEEGMAEIAGEMSSRLAWEATGGPAVGARATGADVTAFTKENYGVILKAARTAGYLSSQPNGVVVTPQGASSSHSVYGSGWHFHRWLGDAYGNASARLADSSFYRTLNDSLTASGVAGILAVTGAQSWSELLEQYAAAVMLNGTGAPAAPRPFTTYDFPSLNRTFTYTGKPPGDYPWPVNVSGSNTTAPFGSVTNSGPIGPSGLRVLDLTSQGVGLGLDVKVGAAQAIQPLRVVVVRLQ